MSRRSTKAAAGRAGVATLLLAAAGVLAGLALLRSRATDRPNLLLVTIDTLRADHVGSYGHAAASTPVLDGLAHSGTRFEHAEASVPLTGPSHSTILTGHYPPVHGVRDNVVFPLDPRHPTLATILKRSGYHTAAFVAAYPVARAFGFGEGFDHFDEGFHESARPGQGAERPASEVADAVARWTASSAKAPFFLWVHFYDPHAPYEPPPPFDSAFPGRPYDGEIAFTDAQLGRVLASLRQAGHADDMLVVVLADHGESLGEHDEQTHAVLVYESTLRVPLLIAGPGVPRGTVVRERVGTVDVLPTILRLVGLGAPEGLPGRDLRPALRGQHLPAPPLYAESLFGRLNCRWASLRAWWEGDWKLIEGHGSELYNLADDPGERRDLSGQEPERLARMRRGLRAAVVHMAPSGDSARIVSISPEQVEKLRSLGYTGGGSAGERPLDDPSLPDPRTHVGLYERLQNAIAARGPAIGAAIEEIADITKRDPGNPHAHFALGSVAYRDGRLKLAEEAYARGLALDPDRPGMRLSYGHLLRDMGRLPESERQLRIAIGQTTADDNRTRVSLAETLIRLGKIDEAGPLVADAIRLAPRNPDALAAQGRLFAAQGRLEEAARSLGAAAESGDADSRIELARVYVRAGDYGRARAAVGAMLSSNPEHPWALAVMGQALVLQGAREEGLRFLRRAEAARPRRPEAWLSLAEGFDAAKEPGAASRCRHVAEALRSSW